MENQEVQVEQPVVETPVAEVPAEAPVEAPIVAQDAIVDESQILASEPVVEPALEDLLTPVFCAKAALAALIAEIELVLGKAKELLEKL